MSYGQNCTNSGLLDFSRSRLTIFFRQIGVCRVGEKRYLWEIKQKMLVFTRRYVCVKAKLTFLSLCPVVFRNLSLLSQSVMPYLLYMSPPTLPPLHCTVRLREGSRGPKRWIFASGKTPQLKISLMSIYLERVTCSSGFLVQNCPDIPRYHCIALFLPRGE